MNNHINETAQTEKPKEKTPKVPPPKPTPIDTVKAYYALSLYAKPRIPAALIA